jgi:ATP-binding cassette subfamily F protein 3
LDIVSIRWITQFLRNWRNELIIISHDREFMDSVTTHTAAIHRRKLRKVQGGTEKLYSQILQEEEIHEKTRLNEEKKRKHEEAFINRFRAQASKASAVQSRVKRLEKMPALEQLAHIDHLDFEFHYSQFFAEYMMQISDLTFGFDPAHPLFENLSFDIKSGDRIAIIGKNGKGKSTLLNVLAGELQPLNGEIKPHSEMKLGYFGQTNINRLQNSLTVETEIHNANNDLSRTAVRGICGLMMFSGDNAEKKISVLSGGEKSRVLLGKILAKPANLLFLDEPTNHLDMESIETLLEALEDFEGAVVIVTHSEMILDALATKLIVFHRGVVELFDGNYREFLEKIGWEEEGKVKVKAPKSDVAKVVEVQTSNPNKKELRKKRSEIIAERSKILSPLKKEMESLEASIVSYEGEMAALQSNLAKVSQSSDVEAFVKHSKLLKELQIKIDDAFSRLEKVTKKHDEKAKGFEALLAEAE